MSIIKPISQAANIYERLRFPFPAKNVKWRIGARSRDKARGSALAYIDARNVMDRLDQVVGLSDWQTDYQVVGLSDRQTDYGESAGFITTCTLSLRINGEWIHKTDGAGKTQVEGEKGAISDALKRAAVQFGVGRYLYMLPDKWLALKEEGTQFADTQELVLPDWATPEGWKKRVLKLTDDDMVLTNDELGDLDELINIHVARAGQPPVNELFKEFKINSTTVWTRGLLEPFAARLNALPKVS